MFSNVSAYNETKNFKSNTTIVAENFIYASQSNKRNTSRDWDGVSIIDEVKLYDFNDNESGYLYITENLDGTNGYITVLNSDGELLVVEASIEPFSYDVNSRLYCVSALGYYNKTNEGFLDLRTGKIVTVESF